MGLHTSALKQTEYSTSPLNDTDDIDIDRLLNIYEYIGLDDGSFFEGLCKNWLKKKLNCETISFIDFAKQTGKNLVICASNIVNRKETYFSLDTTPNICVLFALKASIAIPLVFTPVVQKSDVNTCYDARIEYVKDELRNENLTRKTVLDLCNLLKTKCKLNGIKQIIFRDILLYYIIHIAESIIIREFLLGLYDTYIRLNSIPRYPIVLYDTHIILNNYS